MKMGFLVLINKVFKTDLELLYGIGSYIDITNISKLNNVNIVYVTCKLYIGDIKLFQEIGQTGINFLFEEAWKLLGFHTEKFILSTSFDLT